ncbi:hypothetical protein C4J81_06275 [Deltaproteobacteria bacterium Smac51]|nr:hypothetical protein C4J81_06275 [Deltaproteobacteria bacterium Smac51]
MAKADHKETMIISGNAQKALKILHLLAVCFWVGGALCELLLYYISSSAESGGELFGIMRGTRFVSLYVVVYLGAFGSFFTGLAYSLCTHRGFFRHKWIIIKWATTIYMIACGFMFLGGWGAELAEKAYFLGLAALDDPAYMAIRTKLLFTVSGHMVLFIILTAISVYKPWETKEAIRLLNKKLRVEK